MSMSMTSTTNVRICVHLCPSVAECFFLRNELRNDHRTRGARAIRRDRKCFARVRSSLGPSRIHIPSPSVSVCPAVCSETGALRFTLYTGLMLGCRYCRYFEIRSQELLLPDMPKNISSQYHMPFSQQEGAVA